MTQSITFHELSEDTAAATAQPPESADGIVISYEGSEPPRITPLSAEERAWQAALRAEASVHADAPSPFPVIAAAPEPGDELRVGTKMSEPATEPEVAPEPEEAPLPEPEDDPEPMEPAGHHHTKVSSAHDSEVTRYFRTMPEYS